jgi:hypothetical protein
MKKYYLLSFIILLQSCASIKEEAVEVQVHHQMSNFLNDCQKLGPIQAEAATFANYAIRPLVLSNLRQIALEQYNADSILLVNIVVKVRMTDHYARANGIAFKCFNYSP